MARLYSSKAPECGPPTTAARGIPTTAFSFDQGAPAMSRAAPPPCPLASTAASTPLESCISVSLSLGGGLMSMSFRELQRGSGASVSTAGNMPRRAGVAAVCPKWDRTRSSSRGSWSMKPRLGGTFVRFGQPPWLLPLLWEDEARGRASRASFSGDDTPAPITSRRAT